MRISLDLFLGVIPSLSSSANVFLLCLVVESGSRSRTRPSIGVRGSTRGGIGVATGFIVLVKNDLSSGSYTFAFSFAFAFAFTIFAFAIILLVLAILVSSLDFTFEPT